jgi:hypothetical protein
MTTKELIEVLSTLPEDMEVMIQVQSDDDDMLMYNNILDISRVQYDKDKPEFLALSSTIENL